MHVFMISRHTLRNILPLARETIDYCFLNVTNTLETC